jgi:murein DD-endopeptidase MepM/ murein hydrolase activator NlpD
MARRLAIPLLLILLLAGTASAGRIGERKRAVDDRIAGLQGKIAAANHRESALTSEISLVTSRIQSLQSRVATASNRLARLEGELALYRARLAKLAALYRVQTRKLRILRTQLAIAQRHLEERLIQIYEADDPSTIEVVLSAGSFADMLDRLDYLNELGAQDRLVAEQFEAAKQRMQRARARTAATRRQVARTTRAVAVRVTAQRAERDRLLITQRALAGAREEKQQALASVHESKRDFLHEVEGLQQASAALAAQIRAAQAAAAAAAARAAARPTAPAPAAAAPASASRPSSSGLIWPVSGPVVSGFGMRWGHMHEGIDIAAPSGTPIRAAAAGTVIYAGWMSGYGNLVVVDHAGGLATAYAHQSSIAAGVGASVGQGQVIGYVGCTGHCYGPHLHFEVRVNGMPVDPLAYL